MGFFTPSDKYFAYIKGKSFDYKEAQAFCRRVYGHQLAKPHTQDEFNIIRRKLSGNVHKPHSWWVGLTRDSKQDGFKWSRGSEFNESVNGVPIRDSRIPGYDCFALRSYPTFHFYALPCSRTNADLNFICQRSIIPCPQNPEVTTEGSQAATVGLTESTTFTSGQGEQDYQSSAVLYASIAFLSILLLITMALITIKVHHRKTSESLKTERMVGLTDPSSSANVDLTALDGHYEYMAPSSDSSSMPQMSTRKYSAIPRSRRSGHYCNEECQEEPRYHDLEINPALQTPATKSQYLPDFIPTYSGPYLNEDPKGGFGSLSANISSQEPRYHEIEINATTPCRVVEENPYLN